MAKTQTPPTADHLDQILRLEQRRRGRLWWARRWVGVAVAIAILIATVRTTEINLWELVTGLPRLGSWVTRSWPPDLSELPSFMVAIWETLAIALLGTGFAMVLAFPLSLLIARNLTPATAIALPLRGLLNLLRGIDTAIFALFFVAVVGLGPFAGMLGVAFHTTGSMAKLYAEVLETLPPEPIEAIEVTGCDRLRTFSFAVLPEALPGLVGISLYLWEFNVRSSVILGIVGAGGIGYELLVSLKLLDFGRLATILGLILIMVSAIDWLSAQLRRRLS